MYEAGLYDGAAYLAGYVVELALKARICRLLRVEEYPAQGALKGAFAVHDLDQLLLLAGLKRAVGLASPRVTDHWSLAQPWRPDRRYNPPGSTTRNEARAMLDAIRHPEHGVLRWIAKRW